MQNQGDEADKIQIDAFDEDGSSGDGKADGRSGSGEEFGIGLGIGLGVDGIAEKDR